jgi:hypothetical protein
MRSMATIVPYAWDEGEFAQSEAYANSLPRAHPQAPDLSRRPLTPLTSPTTPVGNGNAGITPSVMAGSNADTIPFPPIGHNSQRFLATAAVAAAAPALQPVQPIGRSAFDEIVKDNRRALYLAQRDVLLPGFV